MGCRNGIPCRTERAHAEHEVTGCQKEHMIGEGAEDYERYKNRDVL